MCPALLCILGMAAGAFWLMVTPRVKHTLDQLGIRIRNVHAGQGKAKPPLYVTLSGMVASVRFLHSQKALSPIIVTPSGMVTLVRDVQQ